MTHAHERQQEDSVELIEDALVMGKLMEVDWTKRTARLERFREKPIKLRFGRALAETMREYATQFVQIEGRRLHQSTGHRQGRVGWTSR